MRAAKWRFSMMGLLEDARNIQRKDPAARSVLEGSSAAFTMKGSPFSKKVFFPTSKVLNC